MNHIRNMYILLIVAVISNISAILYEISQNIFFFILGFPAMLSYEVSIPASPYLPQITTSLFEFSMILYILPFLYLGVYMFVNAGDVTSVKVIAAIFIINFSLPIIGDLILLYGIETGTITSGGNFNSPPGFLAPISLLTFIAGIFFSYRLPRYSQALKSGSNRYMLIFLLIILGPFVWFFIIEFFLARLLSLRYYWLLNLLLVLPNILAITLFIYNTSFYFDHLGLQTEDGDLTYPQESEGSETSSKISS